MTCLYALGAIIAAAVAALVMALPVGANAAVLVRTPDLSGYQAVPFHPNAATVRQAQGLLTVPYLDCAAGDGGIVLWVGIGDTQAARVGVGLICVGTVADYFVFYQGDGAAHLLPLVQVHAGDRLLMEVFYDGGVRYFATVTDRTTDNVQHVVYFLASPRRDTAEWVAQRFPDLATPQLATPIVWAGVDAQGTTDLGRADELVFPGSSNHITGSGSFVTGVPRLPAGTYQ